MIDRPQRSPKQCKDNLGKEYSKPRSRHRKAQAIADCHLLVGLALVDYIAWSLIFNGSSISPLVGGVLHFGILGFLGWLIRSRADSGADVRHTTLALMLGALLGAVGMTIAALVAVSGLLLKKSRQIIDAWYQRQADSVTRDDVAELIGSINNGRVTSHSMRSAENLSLIIREGTFSQKQAIMEVVARSYRPELLPVLNLALTSPVPAIRVQAAAVKGKLYTSAMVDLRTALVDLDRAQSKEDVATAGQRLSQCILSGLLEPDQKLSALTASKKVHDVAGSLKYNDEARELFHDLRYLFAHFDDAAALLVRMEEYGGQVDQHRKQLQAAFEGYERGVSGLLSTNKSYAA
ncbi:MAG: hypothetical protein JXQ99_07570 [Hyphomicrobiaceae bacterium]